MLSKQLGFEKLKSLQKELLTNLAESNEPNLEGFAEF